MIYDILLATSVTKMLDHNSIVHLIRNSVKYIPSKDYKAYTAQLKKVYGAASLKAAEAEFERFKYATETDELYFDISTFQMTDAEDDDLPFR